MSHTTSSLWYINMNVWLHCTADDMNIQDIRTSMKIGEQNEMLLAFAWVSEDEVSKVERFPEFCSIDVTEKTNLEKRGLFQGTFLDGDGGTFIGFRSFLPNSQMSSYNWLYEIAMPELFGEETIKRIQVVMSDGELALYQPIENLSNISSPWEGVKVMRCVYHLFNQPWAKVKGAASLSKSSNVDQQFVDEVQQFMEYMIFHVQNESELNLCIKIFESQLSQHHERISECVYHHLQELWFSSMKPQRLKWGSAFKTSAMDFLHYTSSITESMNASLKQTVNSSTTFAKLNLDNSANEIICHSADFNEKKDM